MSSQTTEKWVNDFVEKGAALEHDRWARRQAYMFSKGTVDSDGVFHLPKEFTDRWFRQVNTPYSELSEPEKESDRKETREYLPLVSQAISEAKEEEGKRIWKEVQEADKKSKCSQHGNISRCQVLEIAINKHQ